MQTLRTLRITKYYADITMMKYFQRHWHYDIDDIISAIFHYETLRGRHGHFDIDIVDYEGHTFSITKYDE